LRDGTGPSAAFTPSGWGRARLVGSRTDSQQFVLASPAFAGSSAVGPESGEQNVAVGEIQRAREPDVREVCREVSNDAGGEIDLHRIAKRLRQEQDLLPVQRKFRSLAKAGQATNV
jgi:hypothetical protein